MQTQRFKVKSLTYHLLPVCLMLAICFLLFFRGLGETEFYDKQEAREALVIWEIHNSGNWILPLRRDSCQTAVLPLARRNVVVSRRPSR